MPQLLWGLLRMKRKPEGFLKMTLIKQKHPRCGITITHVNADITRSEEGDIFPGAGELQWWLWLPAKYKLSNVPQTSPMQLMFPLLCHLGNPASSRWLTDQLFGCEKALVVVLSVTFVWEECFTVYLVFFIVAGWLQTLWFCGKPPEWNYCWAAFQPHSHLTFPGRLAL